MAATSPSQNDLSAAQSGPSAAGAAPKKRSRRKWLIIVVLVTHVGVAAVWAIPRIQFQILARRLDDPDPEVRKRTCIELQALRMPAAVPYLGRVATGDSDRFVVETAGFGLSKIKDPAGAPYLREVVSHGPDDMVLAKLFRYLGRLGGEGEIGFLQKHAASESPWRAIGAAAGLVEAGSASGGPVLLRYMETGDDAQKAFGTEVLVKYAVPMMEMIGQRIDLDVPPDEPLTKEQVAALKAWWSQHATDRLLSDYIVWHERPNPKRRKIVRLIHAGERVGQWLGMENKAQ